MDVNPIEFVIYGLEAIALIIRAEFDEPGIHFFTPSNFSQQVAAMTHPKGHKISAHTHNLVARQVLYTQEVLFIRQGSIKVNLYSSSHEYISSPVLKTGDVILLCGGGHSFEMLEDTSMIEVKQGPYAGEKDKASFEEIPGCR
jgi:mannose-6-phosphate isomerase-like protein (cupin superfamily)